MRRLAASLLFALIVSMLAAAYADTTEKGISSSLLRLHIVANSDSNDDQSVKLAVRDAITEQFGQKLLAAGDIQKAKELTGQELASIKNTAEEILRENGFDYGASASVQRLHFPTRKYDNITLPSGEYDALRIVLGSGGGQNWWCVMYPPLCFSASSGGYADENAKNALKSSLTADEYSIVTESGQIPVKIKFKLLEIFDFISNSGHSRS